MKDTPPFIPICSVDLSGRELEYVTSCIKDGWISASGPFVAEFEKRFRDHLALPVAVACNTGTAALHLALKALDIGPGDEVIVPALTMIATGNAVHYCGATPVIADVDGVSGNITADTIEPLVTSRTRAIVVVHLYGWPCDMEPILALARRHNLAVVEDAAEAIGTTTGGQPAGTLGDLGCFSFFANKVVTTGEGGMVVSRRLDLEERLRRLRDQWFVPERRFYHPEVGFNYRMTNLQAAVGVAQMERIDDLIEKRIEIARSYRDALGDEPSLVWPETDPPAGRNSHWMAAVRVQDGGRTGLRGKLADFLRAEGVDSRDFFHPLHLQPAFAQGGFEAPVAEELGATGLLLPTGPTLTMDQQARVIDALRSSLAKFR